MASSVRRNSRAPGCEEPENNNRSSFDEDDERFKSLSDRLLNRTQGDQHDLSVCYEIEDLVRSALHGAEILASDYTKVLELRQQNESIDFELKAQLFRRGQYTLDNIKEDADNFTGQISALESLTKSTIVEFLHFDMDQLQAELLPSPAKCLDSMRDLLPRLLREKCDKFLQYVSTSSSRIEKPVTQNLDAFTTYLLNIREVFEEVLERESDLAFLYDFFRLLDKLKFKAPLDTTKVFELCGPEFQALKVQVQEAYANRDSDLQSYMPLLTENLSQLGRRTSWLQSAASEQAMTAPTRSSQEARDSAMKLYEEAQQMQQDATKLVHIQQVFEEVSSDPRRPRKTFEELDILSTELRLKSDVWQAVCETDEYLRGCSTDTLHSIDLDKMSALASRVDSVIENTRLNASQIADSFEVDRLEKLQTILHGLGPVIRDLRNPHFAERHWTKLEHKMQCSLAPPCAESEENARAEDLAGTEPLVNNRLSLQVQQLLEVGAVAYATTIRHVSEEATAEAAMAGNFMRVVSTWETTQIPVESRKDRDGRDVHCIGDCIELDALIEESQVLLRVMDLSTYSLVVQDRLPKMISDLELTKGSLELLQICQRQWEYTQRLVSVDFARTFPDQAKKLQKHDTAWRSLTQGLFNRSLCLPFGVNTENREALEAILEGFEAAAKTLSDHLEIKRQIFPAFFQLSDLELATLLSKCRDVNCISAFLFQCFDNVGRIVFGTRDAFQDILQVH
ncbi:hypothetical protein PHYBOEH_006315 [Phytophthora boehmeriae]|uniref:Dynein heavy chain linker domain-containing protein n=1 Tax=Phytophthora boehmeriae TaxID=109152 RepID=A0A8T1WHN6_9STRA|nr:hypothetical protein PHYBOEH_006315 [Phytophthora boehmeriae]